MCVHGEKKTFYGVFVILVLLTIVFIIVSLPIPWLGGKVEDEFGSYKYKITLSNVKVKGNGTLWESKETISLSELCGEAPFNLTSCGIDSSTSFVIAFSVIGLILTVGTWLAVLIELNCGLASFRGLFNAVSYFVILFQTMVYITSFAIYTAWTNDIRKNGIHFHAGWALYLVGMIFSFFVTSAALAGTKIDDPGC